MFNIPQTYRTKETYASRLTVPSTSCFLRCAIVVVLLLLSLSGPIWSEPRAQAAADVSMNDAQQVAIADLVRPDSTLDLNLGVNGALDLSGWNVTLDPALGPLLTPEDAAASWQALGTGLNSTVLAIAVSGNDVYVGGHFTDAGGNPNADKIARWDGASWQALGTGLNDWVRAIAVSGSDVYVGGDFTDAGGNANADYIARWDGATATWQALGTGLNGSVEAIVVSGSDVYVGGGFTNAGGNPNADRIARWNGATWQAFDTGLNNVVYAIAVSGSDVYVGGQFTDAGGNSNADNIARWEGGTWHALGTGLDSSVLAVAVSGSDVYVGGAFTDAGGNPNADYIALWDGATWNALGTGLNDWVSAIAVSGSDVYVGGWFIDAGGDSNANRIARWDGPTWHALDTGLNFPVHALTVDWCDLYVGGQFTDAGGNPNADFIARYGPIECRVYLPMIQKCPCVDIIVNNGFEDNSGWVIPTTEYTAGYTTDLFRTGNRSMRTGITKSSHNKYSYSAFRQMVEIPAGATATLTAHLWRMSEEPDATHIPLPQNWYGTDLGEGSMPDGYPLPPGDVQYLLILDKDMEWIDTLIWQRKDAHEWTKKVYDLSGYAGKKIYIHFGTYNDGEDGISSLHVDDVTLYVCP